MKRDEAHRYGFRNKVEGVGSQKFANLFWTISPKNAKTVSLELILWIEKEKYGG